MHLFGIINGITSLSGIWSSWTTSSQAILFSDDLIDTFGDSYRDHPIPTEIGRPRPVVIWHGLGDQYNSTGILQAAELFNELYPGIFVHSVYLSLDPALDQRVSMFGDANDELNIVCEQLKAIPELEDGFDLMGFSQGGVFSRALVERCSEISVHNLITFGSPHLGVSELPICQNPKDWVCQRRNQLLKRQVWKDDVQKRIIPAQYFRDPSQYSKYILHSNFLVHINNEKPYELNQTYRSNFKSLNKLVLIKFLRDTMVVPKDSAWFIDYDSQGHPIPFEQSRLYSQDLIGLKQLHLDGKVEFLEIDDVHMNLTEQLLRDTAIQYLGKW